MKRELAGETEVLTLIRNALANNIGKLDELDNRRAEVEKHLARERQKLAETDDTEIQQEIQDRIRKIEDELSDTKLERKARLEAASINREDLRSQISRIRDTSMKRRWLSEYEHSFANRG